MHIILTVKGMKLFIHSSFLKLINSKRSSYVKESYHKKFETDQNLGMKHDWNERYQKLIAEWSSGMHKKLRERVRYYKSDIFSFLF
jgi:hypothetical protein